MEAGPGPEQSRDAFPQGGLCDELWHLDSALPEANKPARECRMDSTRAEEAAQPDQGGATREPAP